jgi:hypothetical protein
MATNTLVGPEHTQHLLLTIDLRTERQSRLIRVRATWIKISARKPDVLTLSIVFLRPFLEITGMRLQIKLQLLPSTLLPIH